MLKLFAEPSDIDKLTKPNQVRRKQGLLHVAIGCIYLQSDDKIVISKGQPFIDLKGYHGVLLNDEVLGKVVLGRMSQGRVRPPPDPEQLSGQALRLAELEAACVHVDWIYAHMLLAPRSGYDSPDFEEAVKLVRRTAETLCGVSFNIGRGALNLAEELGIENTIAVADASAEAALVEEHPLQVPVLWAPCAFDVVKQKYLVKQEDKSEARYMFEATVFEVFSFHIRIPNQRWIEIDDIMINTTGMRKKFNEMTAKERQASGSVMLKHIVRDLRANKNKAAILASLTVSRALSRIAFKLQTACDKCTGAV